MTNTKKSLYLQLTYGKRLMLIALMFFVMSIFSSFCVAIAQNIFESGTKEYMLLASSLQALVMFVAPALATAYFVSPSPVTLLGLKKKCNWRNVIGVIIAFVIGMPALNQVIWWNSQLSLPESMASIEHWIMEMESSAAAMQEVMLSSVTLSGLFISIFVVAILTGFAEEIFFRGTLQKIIASNGMNHHVAIWIAAFIFSLLHFQFFGFVPRLLLGAFFGYLFYWTGSIWVSATAHMINNAIVVVTLYLSNIGYKLEAIEHIGVIEQGIPIYALISASILILFFIFGRKYFFSVNK